MNEHLDAPITHPGSDKLGFTEAAIALVSAIENQPNQVSLTLGLDGAWGSGKSSLLGLMKQHVEEREGMEGLGTVLVPFSPWLISNKASLIGELFSQLSEALDEAEKGIPKTWKLFRRRTAKKLVDARKKLNKFSRVVSITSSVIAAIDPSLATAAISGGSGAVEKLTKQEDEGGKSIEKMKQELVEILKDISEADPTFRILVLIDDLDRLDSSEAIEVLRLVKAVGDFPATTYLLAYDSSAIARAIQAGEKVEDGHLYLEKIVQFSFKVPPCEPFQLRQWLATDLKERYPGDAKWDSDHASAVLDVWAGRLLKTPRDVKRLLFAVDAIWPSLRNKISLLDLVWLQLIAQKASSKDKDLYSWLSHYLQALSAIAIGGRVSGKAESRLELTSILRNLGWIETQIDNPPFEIDFHHLDLLLAGISVNHLSSDYSDWTHEISRDGFDAFRDEARLSSPWHWRLYFALETPAHAVTDEEWKALLENGTVSTAKLTESLNSVLDLRPRQRLDTADQILGRAKYQLTMKRLQHPHRWLQAFANCASSLSKFSRREGYFNVRFPGDFMSFARIAFEQLAGDEREETIREIFEQPRNFYPASLIIRQQVSVSRRSGSESGNPSSHLSPAEQDRVVAAQLNILASLDPSAWRESPDPWEVLWAWNLIADSPEPAAKFLKHAMASDEELVSTLEALRCVTSSAQNDVPHVPEDWIDKFLDPSPIKARLKRLSSGPSEMASRARDLRKVWWAGGIQGNEEFEEV